MTRTIECVARPFGEPVRLKFETFEYHNGQTAVQALSPYENDLSMERTDEDGAAEDDWEHYTTLTVSIPDAELEDDEIIVKNWTENAWVGQLLDLLPDVFQDTGKRIRTGFVEAPVWKFTPPEEPPSIADAFQMVIELARENVIDIRDDAGAHAAQMEACDLVEDFVTNNLGDD